MPQRKTLQVDLIFLRTQLGPSSKLLVLNGNLMEHVGKASTLRPRPDESRYIGCGEILGPPVMFSVEAYDPQRCGCENITCEAG